MFFMVPLPSGIFITAIAMFNVYWTDRYMLFNVWRRPPQLDGSLSGVARMFFIFSVWAHVSISRIFFANWPYGGVSGNDMGPKEECNFLFSCNTNTFMTDDQKTLVELYTIGCSITFFIIIIWVFLRVLGEYVMRIFRGFTDDSNEAGETSIRFSEMNGIDAFIPVLNPPEITDPIICVDVSKIPVQYLPIPKNYFNTNDDPMVL